MIRFQSSPILSLWQTFHQEPCKNTTIKVVFIFLSFFAFAFACKSLFLPRWPLVLEFDHKLFSKYLLKVDQFRALTSPFGSIQSHDLSLSQQYRWRSQNGNELIIVNATVRKPLDLQTAYITRNSLFLSLNNRRIDTPFIGTDSGYILGRPAFQTCYTYKATLPTFGTKYASLIRSYPSKVSFSLNTVLSLVGLQPSRSYNCVLVTLRGSPSQPLSHKLWSSILKQLRNFVK